MCKPPFSSFARKEHKLARFAYIESLVDLDRVKSFFFCCPQQELHRSRAREVIWGSMFFWRNEMAEFLALFSRTGHSRRQEKGKGSHPTMLAREARINGLEDQSTKKRPIVDNMLDQKRSSYSQLAWSPSTHLLPANPRWMAQTVTSAIGRPSAAGLCGQVCLTL